MEITFPEINPYKETLIQKAKEVKTFGEFEEVCSVTEYVDGAQMAAIVQGDLPNVPEDITAQEVEEQKALEEKEEDPKEVLRKMYENLKNEEDDDE